MVFLSYLGDWLCEGDTDGYAQIGQKCEACQGLA